MTDKISPSARSENMRRIRSKNTKPELVVRSLVHKLGYRFRLHRKDLPGKPDLVFPSRRKAILVHGCFWHGHETCPNGRRPKSRENYWNPKIDRNMQRDTETQQVLEAMGWQVLVVWECELGNLEATAASLTKFLGEHS